MQAPGKFIVIEGAEGVGKSTNSAYVREHLERAGLDVRCTREPGGTPLGEHLRSLLLEPGQSIGDDAELLLMFAARAQHLQDVIKPSLQQGQWVLCDRFTDASYAYQGGGRGIDSARIAELEAWVQQGLQPDLVLLLDAPADVGLERVHKRGGIDRFEKEALAFFERVRQRYLERAEATPERYRVVDASRELELVQQDIHTILDDYLQQS